MQGHFTKEEKKLKLLLKKICSHCLNHYVFSKNEWKERDLGREEFMPKILEKHFLSEIGYTPLSERENELLNENFGLEDIDKLVEAFNNTEAKEEYNNLLNRISNRASILKKLVKTVSNPIEKKRIKNMIKAVVSVLNYFLNTHKSTESNSSNFTEGQGLKILTPNQMLSRLPITLAQLKAGNNSEKLKNEIRQLLYSLRRSKKLTKQIYKSLIDII